jgi:hypothetical protein
MAVEVRDMEEELKMLTVTVVTVDMEDMVDMVNRKGQKGMNQLQLESELLLLILEVTSSNPLE